MRFAVLEDWLRWQETLHPASIDLGLERIRLVLERLGWKPPTCPIITVAGTKGKGSSVALLESVYSEAGYRVGAFTSPHLRDYTERIRIAGRLITSVELCAVFARIDAARDEISLTYFEFNTLAALLTFETAMLDVWILEVGMGGRLDAVNVVDADVALVTSIGLDHTEWLGDDLNSIAREKAGIYRANKPALFGSKQMPSAIGECAQAVGARLLRAGLDFDFSISGDTWSWRMHEQLESGLPFPGIAGAVQLDNASNALAVMHLLAERLPMWQRGLVTGLQKVRLAGRFQVITPQHGIDKRTTQWVLDVAHNELSARVLAKHLASLPRVRTMAIIGMMSDKDVDGVVGALRDQVDVWLPVSLPPPRGLPADALSARLVAMGQRVCASADTVKSACERGLSLSTDLCVERVLVCGSFMVVGPTLDWLQF